MISNGGRVPIDEVDEDRRMRGAKLDRDEWRAYLGAFHARFPGITEEILGASRSGGVNPYEWLLEAVPARARLLDLACGSAPLLSAGWAGRWVGLDRSAAELGLVGRRHGHLVVPGDARALPFQDGSFDVLACSMALMLLDPLHTCLAEASRVLVPRGVMVVVLPGGPHTLTTPDLVRWTRLLGRLRRYRLTYPNDRAIARLGKTMSGAGFAVAGDERRRFAYRMSDEAAARRFVDSLYLPRVLPHRVQAAGRLAASWAGEEIGIPLRRVVLVRTG